MINGTHPVYAKIDGVRTHLGDAAFQIFETVAEAQAELGDEQLLKVLNSQIQTNAMNLYRSTRTNKPSKTALRQKALAMVTAEEFAACAGDIAKLESLIQSKVAALSKSNGSASAQAEDEDDDDNN